MFMCRQNIQSVFGVDISLPMTKGERILYRDSSPTHAMVLSGVHINDVLYKSLKSL